MQVLGELEERRKRGLASAADLALIHLGLGDHAEALRYLEAVPDESSLTGTVLPALLKVDPIWDPIRPDPRFTALLDKMGFGK